MKENEILDEIHRGRAQHARECGYDIHQIFEQSRAQTAKLKADGWEIVSFGSREPSDTLLILRDELPTENKIS